MIFEHSPEFDREFKSFSKKWRSLPSDLKNAEKVIELLYAPPDGMGAEELKASFFNNKRAAVLMVGENAEAVKMRLECASIPAKSILRITFARCGDRVIFVEIYSKQDKDREDGQRPKKYIRYLLT